MTRELAALLPPYANIYTTKEDADKDDTDALTAAVDRILDADPEIRHGSFSGHLRLRHLRQVIARRPDMRYFTILRDPVARVVSEYRYTRTPKHPNYKDYIEKYASIEDFVADPMQCNKMWGFIGNRSAAPDETKLQQVFNRYAFIGLLETLDRDFQFFTGLLGCPKKPKARSNTTAAATENEVVMTDELHAEISAKNQYDVVLYDAVKAVLDARADEMETFIEERRAAFF